MFSFLHDARARATYTLPLFPLRTVLFPGGVLPLKVFEQRYIELTKACMQQARPFGVCLITQGEEVGASGKPPAFANIGTLARIANFDMPQLGILHVATTGGERFQVHGHAIAKDGLVVAEVTSIADEPRIPLAEEYAPLANLLEVIAARLGPQNFPAEPAYDDASWVSYRLAELLPLPLSIKQSMLEINDAGVRLRVLRGFLEKQGLV